MTDRTIPQRELRNRIGEILRAAESGQTFTVTVRGRPVARLVPLGDRGQPSVDADRAAVRQILELPVDAELAADIDALEVPVAWS